MSPAVPGFGALVVPDDQKVAGARPVFQLLKQPLHQGALDIHSEDDGGVLRVTVLREQPADLRYSISAGRNGIGPGPRPSSFLQ
eukprot:656186-Lingulodinium_polyedra.AAC.1